MTKENPTEFTRDSVVLDFAKISELIVKDLNSAQSPRYTQYTKDNVATYLANPLRNAKNLQAVSAYLYNNSPHYRRLINYYAHMPTLDFFIEPYGVDFSKNVNIKSFKNNYQKAVDVVELMNIKHEYSKALISAWKLGTFYGYELTTKDSYFIMELPYDFCQISGIMDGVFTFNFDVSYFDRNSDQIDLFPKEFKSMYNKFKSGSKPKWQEVNPLLSVCIKINEENYYDVPPFAGIFSDIFDIEDYKSLRKINTVLGNYKFIVEKIPMRKDSDKNNDFLIDLKTVGIFHNKTANMLPEEIGIFSTPFEVDTVEFKKDNDKDSVAEALKDLYDGSGVSQLLFNGSNNGQANLAKSINVDEAEIFALLRQIERIISVKIKNDVKGTFKYRLKILNNTIFNQKENIDMYLKNAQFGLPVISMLCASLGLSPSAIQAMNYLENDVLGLIDSFKPLASSHTQSGTAPTNNKGNPSTSADNNGGATPQNPDNLSPNNPQNN